MNAEEPEIELPSEDKKYLTDKEYLKVLHCFDNDKVMPLKPLVEEYGWTELLNRFRNSVHNDDSE